MCLVQLAVDKQAAQNPPQPCPLKQLLKSSSPSFTVSSRHLNFLKVGFIILSGKEKINKTPFSQVLDFYIKNIEQNH